MFKKVDPIRFRHERLLAFMNEHQGGLRKEGKVLDVGCGPGWFVELLASNGFCSIYGCDYKGPENLDFKDFNFEVVNLNEQDLPYNEKEFDVVVCSDVLEHLENPSRCLRDIRRVIKPNGVVYMTIPNCANILQRIYFLLLGNSKRFRPELELVAPHISMTPSWIFRFLIKDKFRIARIGGDGFIIHGRLISCLPATSMFSYTLFMELNPNLICSKGRP